MFEGAKVYSLLPGVQPGKGGAVTSVPSTQPGLDVRSVFGCQVFHGRWRKSTKANGPLLNSDLIGTTTQALHPYSFFANPITNPATAPTTWLLAHTTDGVTTDDLFNHTTGTVHRQGGLTIPATFQNVKNRCYVTWGRAANFIIDGNKTGVFQCYDVGVNPPAAAPLYYPFASGATATQIAGAAFTTNGGSYIVKVSGATTWSTLTLPTPMDVAGVRYQATVYTAFSASAGAGTITTMAGANQATVVATWPSGGAYNGLSLTCGGNSALIASYTVAAGVTTVTFQSNFAANNVAQPYTLTGDRLTLDGTWAGLTAWSAPINFFTGAVSWAGIGPKYAYAYYDPISGHISNGSPILTITEQAQVNVNPTLNGMTGSTDSRFTKIKVFRTLINAGNILFPLTGNTGGPADLTGAFEGFGTTTAGSPVITLVSPNLPTAAGYTFNAGAVVTSSEGNKALVSTTINSITCGSNFINSANMWVRITANPNVEFVDSYKDSTLVLDGRLQLPQFTNDKPPIFNRAIYWDGRLWGQPMTDPSALRYSASPDQAPFGVAEESYPATNVLRIPAADGAIQGFELIGNQMVITTDRYAYTVVGSNQNNYRLVRFSTVMMGVGDYMVSEMPGDMAENSDSLVFLGPDKKVYAMAQGYGTVSLSDPIQEDLNAAVTDTTIKECRIKHIRVAGRRLVALSIPHSDLVWCYDLDNKVWTTNPATIDDGAGGENYAGPRAMTALFGASAAPITEYFGFGGELYSWYTGTTGVNVASVRTFPMDFGSKSLKRLHAIRIYVSSAAATWSATVKVDETTSYAGNFALYADQVLTIQPTGSSGVDASGAKELLWLPASSVSGGVTIDRPIMGHRFDITVTFPTATTVDDLYRVDLLWSDDSDQEGAAL